MFHQVSLQKERELLTPIGKQVTVNGHQMKVNVHKSIIIDTDRIITYSKDGTLQNAMISGEYEDMYLLYGDNDVSISPSFDLKVIPNWRYDNDSSI